MRRIKSRHLHHQIRQPFGGVEAADGARGDSHRRKTRRILGQRGQFRREPVWSEVRLHDADRAACIGEHAGIGELVLIDRTGQRHENGRASDGTEFGHRTRARARDDDVTRRQPRRQVGEERRKLRFYPQPIIDRAHPRHVFVAHLLRQNQPLPQRRSKLFDCARHDVAS